MMTEQHLISVWSAAHLNLNCCKRVLSQVRSPRRHAPLLPAMPVHMPTAHICLTLLSSFVRILDERRASAPVQKEVSTQVLYKIF